MTNEDNLGTVLIKLREKNDWMYSDLSNPSIPPFNWKLTLQYQFKALTFAFGLIAIGICPKSICQILYCAKNMMDNYIFSPQVQRKCKI